MEHVIYKLYEELKQYTNQEVPSFSLEIKKYRDDYYVIGDRLDVFRENNPLYGASHNQFLLFIYTKEPYIMSVCFRKNKIFSRENIFMFTHEILFTLLEQSHFEGILQVDTAPGGSKVNYLVKRYIFGEYYKELYSLIKPFIPSHTKMHTNGSFCVPLSSYIPQVEFKMSSDGIVFGMQNQQYRTIHTKEDLKQILKTLKEKEQGLIQLKKDIASIPTTQSLQWKEGNRLLLNDTTFISHMRITVIQNTIFYVARTKPYGELYSADTNGIMQLVQDKIKCMQ